MSATVFPNPLPTNKEVGASISLIPGPPFGPSYRIIITSPSLILSVSNADIASSSQSKHFATPSNS